MSEDLIRRSDALKALGEEPENWTGSDYEIAIRNQWNADRLAIETVPSAQPNVHDRNVGEWEMFELITSTWYGKQCYFVEENGIVYSRVSGKYMSVDEAIKEFLGRIGDNE